MLALTFLDKVVIMACRKDQPFYAINSTELDEILSHDVEDSRSSDVVQKPLSSIETITFLVFITSFFFIGFTILLKYASKHRLGPHLFREEVMGHLCLNKNSSECLKNQEYLGPVAKKCGDIDVEDITYKLMKMNFDQAVLRETVALKGHRRRNVITNQQNNTM